MKMKTDIRNGWEIKKLGEVCEFKSGTTIDKKLEKNDGEVIYAKVGDMNLLGNEEYITTSSRYVDFKSINLNQIIPVGSIIFPKRGGAIATNKKRRIVEPTIVDLNTMALVPSKIIDENYLFFWFQQIDLSDLSNGTSIPQINNYSFDGVHISYPKSLSEQQRIVSILDEAFAAIAVAKTNAEQNLKNAKELFESYLQEVFENKKNNWEICNLETNIKLIDYRGRTPVKTESGIRLITAKNVKLGYLQLEPQEFIAEDNYERWMSRGIPNFGDVIFTTEAPLANVAQIDTSEKLAFAQRIIVMQPKPLKLNQTFLKYMLLSSPIRNKILSKGTGATVLGIKSSLLKKIEICFPKSIEDQQAIVQKLDALSAETKRLEAIYQQKILDLEELKKSVLQKAFNGEL
jgi:type I restriction enzyme S subunit